MLYATDTSTTIKRTLNAEGRAKALRLCPWGNGVRGFTGAGLHGERDEGIGLYMLGAGYRGYMPSLRRFIAPDSWSPFGRGGINAYIFCEGDPINRKDPTGHVPIYLFNALFRTNYLKGFSNASLFKGLFRTRKSAVPTYRAARGWEDLPSFPDVFDDVLGYLSGADLKSAREVSKSWNAYISPLPPSYRKSIVKFTNNAKEVYVSRRDIDEVVAEGGYRLGLMHHAGSGWANHPDSFKKSYTWITGLNEPLSHRDIRIDKLEGPVTERFDLYMRGLFATPRSIRNNTRELNMGSPQYWAQFSRP